MDKTLMDKAGMDRARFDRAQATALAEKFARYFLTGGVAAIVDAGGFQLFINAGVNLIMAAATSFCVAAIVNFLATSAFVFGSAPTWRRFVLFFSFAALGLAINAGVTVLAVKALGAPPLAAKIFGIGFAFVFNFLFNAFFVFRRREA